MQGGNQRENIPGTTLKRAKMDNTTGIDFIDKVFFITDTIMLAQIREITGIDGTTLQNWLKRGWVGTPKKKSYTKEHLARILIINMMRDTMQLSRIIFTLEYINGRDSGEGIIAESLLYDYACRTIDAVTAEGAAGLSQLDKMIDEVISGYAEPVTGAKKRLKNGLHIITVTYYASVVKAEAESMLDSLGAPRERKR